VGKASAKLLRIALEVRDCASKCNASVPDCVSIFSVVGVPSIFAKKPRMVARIFKALTENGLQNSYDPLALPIPWDHQVRTSELFNQPSINQFNQKLNSSN